MPVVPEYLDLNCRLEALDSAAATFSEDAAALRVSVDHAYEKRSITLHQWRTLIEETSLRQARHATSQPDGWRWVQTLNK